MVTTEEYDKAQMILGKKGKPRKAISKDFEYRGFLFCKECGCQITAQEKSKTLKNGKVLRYIYYHCTRKRPCNNRKTVEEKNIAKQLYTILDTYTIHPQFEEWALDAVQNMNAGESKEREAIENAQFKALQQLRQQYDKLVDMASKELIQDDKFKEKSEVLLAQIKDMESDTADTINRAESWRNALYKTIDVIAHGRERFESGDLIAKRDVLLALGSTPTLYGGEIELTVYDWLVPLQNGLPALKEEYDKVRNLPQQMKKASEEAICKKWLGMRDSNPRCQDQNLVPYHLANPHWIDLMLYDVGKRRYKR